MSGLSKQSSSGNEFLNGCRNLMPLLGRHLQSHSLTWVLFALLLMVVGYNYRLGINETQSLAFKVFLIRVNSTLKTGDYVSFRWYGGKPYPDGIWFTKRILAGPGEVVVKQGRNFRAGSRILIGKTMGLTHTPLFPNDQLQEGINVLPPGQYFVAGDHEYSLDSRYHLVGLVDESLIVGRAYPLF